MTDLDAKVLAALGAPFTAAAVKFKPQTVTKDQSKGLASFYIDARLAAERLNEVVGVENWTDEYRLLADGRDMPALFYPIECRLTACGVTKVDVGQGANTVLDDKAWKSAYSDALKRAAVKFRIGAYLYTLPNLWAPVKVGANGKAQGFSDEGMKQLRGQYERWIGSPANRFGPAFDHGDVLRDDGDKGGETPPAPEVHEPADAAKWQWADKLAHDLEVAADELGAGEITADLIATNRAAWQAKGDPDGMIGWLEKQLTHARESLAAKDAAPPLEDGPLPEEPLFTPPAGKRGSRETA